MKNLVAENFLHRTYKIEIKFSKKIYEDFGGQKIPSENSLKL